MAKTFKTTTPRFKARVERLNIYANDGHVPAYRESVKTVDVVKTLDDGRLIVRFGKRTGTVNRTRTELQASCDGKKPVRYGLIEIVEGSLEGFTQ